MFAILPDIWSVISRKVVLGVCGRKIKNSWLNPFFFHQSSKLAYVYVYMSTYIRVYIYIYVYIYISIYIYIYMCIYIYIYIYTELEKYEDLQEQCVRNGWITHILPIEVGCRSFITNSTSVFKTNLGLPPSNKWKYMENIQDALTASAWIWESHRVTTI